MKKIYYLTIFLIIFSSAIYADVSFEIHGIYMEPNGKDAADYSDAGLGLGGQLIFPWVPNNPGMLVGGIDYINLLSETTEYYTAEMLRVDHETNQNYWRLFFGGRLSVPPNMPVRPYVGANLALVIYRISTDVVIPDDEDEEDEIRQHLKSDSEVTFGYDFNAGLSVDITDGLCINGGVRYLKSFSVPIQLYEGSKEVHPEYFQIYIGISSNGF